MKTYTIEQAKAINANILTIEKLQTKLHVLETQKEDLRYWIENKDHRMAEAEEQAIVKTEILISTINASLSENDIKFSDNNKIYFINGEGGRDMIGIE